MPSNKYEFIYQDLKQKIESEEYPYQSFLPSEYTLIEEYDCSRNTARRAIAQLALDGYVQSIKGKGVIVIYQPIIQTAYTIGGIESFKESSLRNHKTGTTKVIEFKEMTINKKTAKRTGFPEGTEIYYLRRIHYLDKKPLILNENYFLHSVAEGLTPEIAENSIYEFLENEKHMTIVNSQRIMTVEKATADDEKYLKINLKDYNCMAVVTSHTYNGEGVMFEFSQSRHRPDYFRFLDNALRRIPQIN